MEASPSHERETNNVLERSGALKSYEGLRVRGNMLAGGEAETLTILLEVAGGLCPSHSLRSTVALPLVAVGVKWQAISPTLPIERSYNVRIEQIGRSEPAVAPLWGAKGGASDPTRHHPIFLVNPLLRH